MCAKLKSAKRLAVLASGNGSNACALIQRAQTLSPFCEMLVCISDNPDAEVLSKASAMGVKSACFPLHKGRLQQEQQIAHFMEELSLDWIFLAGYMRILSPQFVEKYTSKEGPPSKIINIHPSLLPRHPGLHAYKRSFEDAHPDAGITIHFVDSGVDSGPIITQKKFQKIEGECFAEFQARGLAIEHEIYPDVLESLVMKGVQWER